MSKPAVGWFSLKVNTLWHCQNIALFCLIIPNNNIGTPMGGKGSVWGSIVFAIPFGSGTEITRHL